MNVKIGQVWQDNDKRCQHAPRLLTVVGFDGDRVLCQQQNGRLTRISESRMRPTSNGYRLVRDVQENKTDGD